MTSVTAAAGGALLALAAIAAGSGRALSRRAEANESAAAALIAAIALLLDGDGVLGGVALVLGFAAVARYAYAVISATRQGPARLFAALERESAAKGRFLPRALVDRLGRSSFAEVMIGDRRTEPMTVVFADIRDSTSLTEELSSEEAFTLIADFFARSARVVRAHRGSIDRYLGDGYMALFPRCVEDALDAAAALQRAVADLNREALGPPIAIGVGLHTGPVTFGTVGDARHIDTTAVSDTVNTAKRVEGLSKLLRVPVIATDEVLHALRDPHRYVTRALGPQQIRGKREPVEVFAVETEADVRGAPPVLTLSTTKRTG